MATALLGLVAVLVVLIGVPWSSGPAPSGGSSDSASPSSGSGTSGGTDHGIVFGNVAVFTQPKPIAAVPVTNATDQVRSFTVRTTFKKGGDTAATAVATVYDLLPKSSRVAILSLEGSIAGETSASAAVDTVITVATTTAGSEAAVAQKLGQPNVTSDGAPTVTVPVTNSSRASHSFILGAAVWRGGTLIGVASITVSDLGSGQLRTFSMRLFGEGSGDKVTVWVDHVLK